MAEDLVALWCCDVTGNPVGTDTVAIGQPSCECQGCRAADLIDQQAASLAAKDKEIERLRELTYGPTGQTWKSHCTEMCAKEASTQCKLVKTESRAEQAERALTETQAHLAMRNSDHDEARRALADAVEVMRPFALREMQDIKDEVDNYSARYQSQWFADSLAAARAFVAQHGSDSREGK